MRVAVVTAETTHHVETDAAARLGRLAELLAGRGHDVTVFCARWWEGTAREFAADGITYHAIAEDAVTATRRVGVRLVAGIVRFGPDVVHAAQVDPSLMRAARVASKLARAPLVVDWYDDRPTAAWRRRARRRAAATPDAVITPSRLVKTSVRELGRDDVDVIPSAIDVAAVRAAEPAEVADIVYSRRLDDDANLESLLLALAELRDVGWRAAVIGDGPNRRQYERQASDLRIDDRVRFLGDQPVERRRSVFKGAHVYVHTARRTPFADDLLRALACGCIGIAEYHAASSAHELVEHRDYGIRTTSEAELVDAIRRAADQPAPDVDADFDAFDERAFLERYLACYRTHQS